MAADPPVRVAPVRPARTDARTAGGRTSGAKKITPPTGDALLTPKKGSTIRQWDLAHTRAFNVVSSMPRGSLFVVAGLDGSGDGHIIVGALGHQLTPGQRASLTGVVSHLSSFFKAHPEKVNLEAGNSTDDTGEQDAALEEAETNVS